MRELVDQYEVPADGVALPSGDQSDDTVEALRRLIAEGDYNPGDRLPPERELTKLLGVTRAALRKALDTLTHEGGIWRHVGKGTFVSGALDGAPRADLAELSQKVSPMQMMRARLSLEPAIAREAAIHASEASVTRLKAARDKAIAAESWDAYEAADDRFHRAVAEASENALLLALFDQLNEVRRAVAWDSVVRQSARPPRDHGSFAEHESITDAIAARNAVEAHAAMRAHLGSVSSRLFGDA